MAITWRVPVLVLLGIGAVLVRPEAGTVWLWLLLVLVLMALDVLLAASRSTLSVVRRPSRRTRQGEPTSTTLAVTANGRRRVRGVLRDAWQPSAGATANRHRLALTAGQSVTMTTDLRPVRRGDLRAERVTVRTLGPLGLAGRQGGLDVPGTVRVLPAFPSIRHLPSRLARLQELDGRAAVRVRGQGTEFDSLREYVLGDDVRSVDWRASARNRAVVVRTWQPERDRRVVLVLDTGRTSAGRVGDIPRLDSAMDAALLLATIASRAGDRVSFVAGDLGVRSRIKGTHRRDVVGDLQDAMAGLQPVLGETNWARLVGAVDSFGRQRSLVVLLTPLEPSAVESGLLPLVGPLTRRHRCCWRRCVTRRSTGSPGNARTRARRTTRPRRSRPEPVATGRPGCSSTLGVEVLDADAEQLPVRLADHYLALKARGLL